jgi:hypothetical protein
MNNNPAMINRQVILELGLVIDAEPDIQSGKKLVKFFKQNSNIKKI